MTTENTEARSDLESPSEEEARVSVDEVGKEPSAESAAEAAAESADAKAIDAELNDVRERYLRLAAEYDNFRKRTDRERLESRDRAQAQIVRDLLGPLDDLQRVSHFSVEGTSVEAILEGIQLVEKNFMRVLENAGLEKIEAGGQPFDPELHEAVMMTPTDESEEDSTVGEVFQSGYRFRGSLLRPAQVQVRQHGG